MDSGCACNNSITIDYIYRIKLDNFPLGNMILKDCVAFFDSYVVKKNDAVVNCWQLTIHFALHSTSNHLFSFFLGRVLSNHFDI